MKETPRELLRQFSQARARHREGEGFCTGERLALQPSRDDFLRRADGGGRWDTWEVAW